MKINKRILIIAYACESDKGSEPAVGWNWTKMLAEIFTEVHIITRENNIVSIKRGLYEEKISNVHIIGYDLSNAMKRIKKKFGLTRVYYYLWQIGAVRRIKKGSDKFDIIQHVTFVNDYIPSLFYKVECDKFIWGPIGSNDRIPKIFMKSSKENIKEHLKHNFKILQRKIDLNFNRCIKKSDYIIGTNRSVIKNLKLNNDKFSEISAIGIEKIDPNYKIKTNENKIIMFCGNLVPIKNPNLALDAFIKFNAKYKNSEFWIVGDGPELNNMKDLVLKYGKKGNVRFLGRVNREECINKMRQSDIVLFPTVESAGFVTLESMSVGTPVVSLNIGGPSKYLPSELQVDIDELMTLNQISDKMYLIMDDVINNYEYYSKQCINKCNEYTWDNKKQSIKKIYAKLIEG